MAFFQKPEDILIAAMSAKQPVVRLERYVGALELAFKRALCKERRLCAFLSRYQANYMKKGLVQLVADYDITLEYQENAPESLTDVIIDNQDFNPNVILTPGVPKEIIVVTDDTDRIEKEMDDFLTYMLSCYEGIAGWTCEARKFDKLTDDSVMYMGFPYIVPKNEMKIYQSKAVFNRKLIWKEILGKANVPQFVKVFLAFSYLMQECEYDQAAYDEVERDPSAMPSDPIPHLAYGPLVEKRGICGGMAWAFKQMMDEAAVPCICVSGYLKPEQRVLHMWNMVKLEQQYYHVDTTWGLKDQGVFVEGLLKSDHVYKKTHEWEEKRYPKATGMRYQYDFIEDFLFDHGNDYLDEGANEKYLFPENIIE